MSEIPNETHELKHEQIEAKFTLGENGVSELMDFFREVKFDLIAGVGDAAEIAVFLGKQELERPLLDMAHELEFSSQVYKVPSSFYEHFFAGSPVQEGERLDHDDQFKVHAFNREQTHFVSWGFGPNISPRKKILTKRLNTVLPF